MAPQSIVCVYCERTHAVNADGKIRQHTNPATGRICQGSGRPGDQSPLSPFPSNRPRGRENPDPYAGASARKRSYLEAMDAADRWATAAVLIKRDRERLQPFMTGVPRNAGGDLAHGIMPDHVFWLGEITNNIRHAIDHDRQLTAQDRRDLIAVLEMREDQRVRARGAAERGGRANPANVPAKAIQMFRRFHTRDYRGDGDLAASLKIPDRAICAGTAVNVMYASDKLNPETAEDEGWIDYIHEHSSGVHVYRCDRGAQGDQVAVPAWLRGIDQITWLGDCLGFEYRNGNGRVERAHGTKPLPELYCTTNGRALLVIQSKRTLLAMMWGGKLGVERRGIVH